MAEIKRRGQKTTESLVGKLNFEQDRNRIIGRDNANTLRLQILADGTQFNFKVSPPGVDASTASDELLIFNSDNNLFKIVDSGQVSLFIDAIADGSTGTGVATVVHNLGYNPLVIAFSSTTPGGETYTRQFGGSHVVAKSVTTTEITIGVLTQENISSTSTVINFSKFVSTAMGIPIAASTTIIDYYIIAETAPPA